MKVILESLRPLRELLIEEEKQSGGTRLSNDSEGSATIQTNLERYNLPERVSTTKISQLMKQTQ